MKTILLILTVFIFNFSNAEELKVDCKANLQLNNPKLKLEHQQLEEFTKQYIKDIKGNNLLNEKEYIIPVVFHIFGTDFNGKDVTLTKIINSLNQVNDDFNGRNEDYETSDPYFDEVKSKLKIRFLLAKKDPEGNPTDGILFYDEKPGLANDDNQINNYIKSIAWDNKSYMNVYITLDLFGDGSTVNSGYAYYPSMSMTNEGTARVVYNGSYLTGNTSYKFASVLTHEFGHWLNLLHTFEGGCTYPNDHVDDTPPADESNLPCPSNNCEGNPINSENFMDYATNCYSMFTNGQVERMKAALEHQSRVTLWQYDNLVKVGLEDESSVKNADNAFNIYPNPLSTEYLHININNSMFKINNIKVYDIFGREVKSIDGVFINKKINLVDLTSGVYLIRLDTDSGIYTKKLILNKK